MLWMPVPASGAMGQTASLLPTGATRAPVLQELRQPGKLIAPGGEEERPIGATRTTSMARFRRGHWNKTGACGDNKTIDGCGDSMAERVAEPPPWRISSVAIGPRLAPAATMRPLTGVRTARQRQSGHWLNAEQCPRQPRPTPTELTGQCSGRSDGPGYHRPRAALGGDVRRLGCPSWEVA